MQFNHCSYPSITMTSVVASSTAKEPDWLQIGGNIDSQILLDGKEHWGVIRAASDLAQDFERVTGHRPSLQISNADTDTGKYKYFIPKSHKGPFELDGPYYFEAPQFETSGVTKSTKIILGTIGQSRLIDDLIAAGKIDAAEIKGKWETFISKIIDNPFNGVDRALVIAGSDKRGSIFGIYDVSRQIGVSPFYWWADVASIHHDAVFAVNTTKIGKSPSIKYRGFFINDEEPCLSNWAKEKYPQSEWGSPFGSDFYKRVFELVLRLRANYLWPAMWASMFHVDDPKSAPLADAYGVVMGGSHTEPLMRATHEWPKFGNGAWQWNINKQEIQKYFELGVERAKPYENIYNLAMRGYDDFAMDLDRNDAINVLTDVVAYQRTILPKDVPQMWCIYKEVQGYFEGGMTVPEDVILLWCDDNWGNIRRLPTENERGRSGGAGLYYHFDYVGDPRNYKWLNTVSLQRTWEQLTRAYKLGADKVWILNVGDIKPLELPMNFYFDLAYDMESFHSVDQWLVEWGTRYFGSYGAKVAQIANTYSRYAARRKFELLDPNTYSLINYNEAETILGQWEVLEKDAVELGKQLSSSYYGFYQLILHPIKAAHNLHRLYITCAKNNLYAEQKRSSTNQVAAEALSLFRRDKEISDEYHALLDGKWNHIMEQTHIGYSYWQQPMRDAIPPLQWIQDSIDGTKGVIAITVEGSLASVPGDDRFHDLNGIELTVPPLEPHGAKFRYVEVFSRAAVNTKPYYWALIPKDSFVTIEPNRGSTDSRAAISINSWGNATSTSIGLVFSQSKDTIEKAIREGYTNNMAAYINVPVNPVVSSFKGYIESDGCISMEATQPTALTETKDAFYNLIDGLGRTGSGMALWPEVLPTQDIKSSPRLEYRFQSFTKLDTVPITVYCSPSLNIYGNRRLLKYAIAVDDEKPQYVDIAPLVGDENVPSDWEQGVADNIWKRRTVHRFSSGEHILNLWAVEPGVVFEKIVIDLGGVRESYLGPPSSYRNM